MTPNSAAARGPDGRRRECWWLVPHPALTALASVATQQPPRSHGLYGIGPVLRVAFAHTSVAIEPVRTLNHTNPTPTRPQGETDQ